MYSRRQKGQTLVFGAFFLFLIVGLMILGAFMFDQRRMGEERRIRQNAVDNACWNAAIALATGSSWSQQVIATLTGKGYGAEFYSPQIGSGSSLARGYTLGSVVLRGIPVPLIRVAVWGKAYTVFHSFIGRAQDFDTGDRAMCTSGLGGLFPILIKEYENEPGDWHWGDTVVMFGDGWNPNDGANQAPTGIGNPDIYCIDAPGDQCANRWYRDPPAPTGAQVNTLKDIVLGYMKRGYDGPLTPVGTYIPRQAGLSNHQTVRAFLSTHGDGDYVAVMIIKDGDVYNGVQGFDFVQVIGYAIFQVDSHDANTVRGHPVTPLLTSASDLYQYPVDPTLLTWQ